MKIEDWTKPAVPLTGDTWLQRADYCRSLLYCHGLLTDRENDKVHERLVKEAKKCGFIPKLDAETSHEES